MIVSLLAALVALIALVDGRVTEAVKLESVVFASDAQGHLLPDSAITITFNKPLTEDWLKQHLRLSPSIKADVTVTSSGRWLRKSRLTINPRGERVFATDSVYRVELSSPYLSVTFETIPTPKVVRVEPNGGPVKTTEPLILVFDRPMATRATATVAASPQVALQPLWYGDRALVLQHPRLPNSTVYEVLLPAGIKDAEGHAMEEAFRFSFRTADPPVVADFGPVGEQVGLQDAVRVTFSTGADRGMVEAAFQLDPPASGSFEWPDPRTLIWRPNRLRPGQSYQVSVGGASQEGDPIVPATWRFRTTIPPPQVTPGGGSKVVFTFDDDPPSVGQAYALLDILSRYQVPAIFFPTGAWAAANPEFMRRARAEGHLVCNHTYTHADLTSLTEEAVRSQILGGAGTDHCNLLRPPYLAHNAFVDEIAASLGYRIYLWTVDSRDWEGLSARDITNLVLTDVRPGAVILFHSHGAHTLEALPTIIERLRAAEYMVSY